MNNNSQLTPSLRSVTALIIILFISSGCGQPEKGELTIWERVVGPTAEKQMEVCGVDANADDPPRLGDECLKKRNNCPINTAHNYEHKMIFIDSTMIDNERYEVFPKNLENYIRSKIINTSLWVEEVAPYTRLSIFNLNDDRDPFEERALFSMCRPPSGVNTSNFSADKVDTNNENPMTKQRNYYNNFLKPTTTALETLKKSDDAKYTILFEQIRALTEFKENDFRDKDYQKRSLYVFSDLMQFSPKFNFYKTCNKKFKCEDFEDLYNTNADVKDYLDDLKPLVGNDTTVHIYHYLADKKVQKIREKLEKIWTGYFIWAGVPEAQVNYIRISELPEDMS